MSQRVPIGEAFQTLRDSYQSLYAAVKEHSDGDAILLRASILREEMRQERESRVVDVPRRKLREKGDKTR